MPSLFLKEIVAIRYFHIFATFGLDCIGNVGRGWSWWELYKTEIGFTVKCFSSFYFCSKQKLHTLATIFITNAFFHCPTTPNKVQYLKLQSDEKTSQVTESIYDLMGSESPSSHRMDEIFSNMDSNR